jgi:hypothetical protein
MLKRIFGRGIFGQAIESSESESVVFSDLLAGTEDVEEEKEYPNKRAKTEDSGSEDSDHGILYH